MEKSDKQYSLEEMRHTAAHVLAAASTKLRPETKLGVGPAIEDGFYHDMEVDVNYTEADLKKLEKEMKNIRKMNLPISQREVSKDEARKIFSHDPYKLELIDEFEGDTVGISDMGEGFFVTLCKGGHVPSTKHIGHFKLTRLAGVYWKGDADKPQLQRIYGVLFSTKEDLDEHLKNLEEAKKRDHRKLGQQLDLFTFSPLVGPGLPLFTPRGTVIREELKKFLQTIQEPLGYQEVTIPHIAKADLYKTSGHWDKFHDDLFHVKGKSEASFVMKPMNCPHHTQIYASKLRSYKDLPLRFTESTMVYRDEQAGELQGLTRVRSITQDDAHIFCAPDQIKQVVDEVLTTINEFYKAFDFVLEPHLSVRDPKEPAQYLGDDKIWTQAEKQLDEALSDKQLTCQKDEGEAAFYGPKIDFIAKDSLNRKWQLATIQLDFNMPVRFNLTYTDSEGKNMTPVMIHRAILGSYERFTAILLEHYAGALPLWLSPVQVAVLPISDQQLEYADQIHRNLKNMGIKTELDSRSESIGKKIREAQMQKTPIMLIIGQTEVDGNTVSVRSRDKGDQGSLPFDKFKTDIVRQIKERS